MPTIRARWHLPKLRPAITWPTCCRSRLNRQSASPAKVPLVDDLGQNFEPLNFEPLNHDCATRRGGYNLSLDPGKPHYAGAVITRGRLSINRHEGNSDRIRSHSDSLV